MFINLPKLAILPIKALVPHENHDEGRALPLIESLQRDGRLSNPPIVAPLQDGSGLYVVLDGANRTTAFRLMESPHILVQVVQPDKDRVALKTWNHALKEVSPQEFLTSLRAIPDLVLTPSTPEAAYQEMLAGQNLVVIKIKGIGTLGVETQTRNQEIRVRMLNTLVNSYKNKARAERTQARDLEMIDELFTGLCALVIFPHFEISEVLELAGKGVLLPNGITRFTISPRALRVNYPLEALLAERPIEDKNKELQRWIQQRIADRSVRYYTEETVLFDE